MPSKIYVEISKEQAGGRKGRRGCWEVIFILMGFKIIFPFLVKKRRERERKRPKEVTYLP